MSATVAATARTFVATLADSAPWMVLGFLLAGFVHVFVERKFLVWWLGGSGFRPVLRAAVVGACLPVCSCGVVPIALGLHRSGASKAAVMAFLVTGPALSPATLLVMTARLGPAMTGCYAIVAVAAALVAARVVAWLDEPSSSTATAGAVDPVPLPSGSASPARPKVFARRIDLAGCREVVRWGLGEFGAEMSVDIVFGLLVATIVTQVVPPAWIASRLGPSAWSTYALVALLATPMYVCTLPSIPVIRALIQHGMSPGAGLTYLFSGSATNLGELRAMSRRLGPRVAWVFAVVVGGAGVLGGFGSDLLLGGAARSTGRAASTLGALLSIETIESPGVWLDVAWVSVGSVALVACLLRGVVIHLAKVWRSPCGVCAFWARQAGTRFSACSQPCWLLRLHRAVRRAGVHLEADPGHGT